MPVATVICLGYPFWNPSIRPEPERYQHLAGLTAPTLVFQGGRDDYGGSNLFGDYPLSPSVRVHLLSARHDCDISSDAWDMIARFVLEFCKEVLR